MSNGDKNVWGTEKAPCTECGVELPAKVVEAMAWLYGAYSIDPSQLADALKKELASGPVWDWETTFLMAFQHWTNVSGAAMAAAASHWRLCPRQWPNDDAEPTAASSEGAA